MGRIKWDSLAVAQAMDAAEDILLSARPLIDEAIIMVEAAQALPDLPDYMTYSLSSLRAQIDGSLAQLIYRIHSTKGYIPETAPTTPKRDPLYMRSAPLPVAIAQVDAQDKQCRLTCGVCTAECNSRQPNRQGKYEPDVVDLQAAEEREIDRMLDINRPAPRQPSLF
jgi:hypothetical protein